MIDMPSRKKISVGGQEIIFGSSKKMDEIPDESVALFITSPPYWDLKDYGASNEEVGSSSYEQYLDDLSAIWRECFRKAYEGSVLVINVNSRRVKKRFYPLAFDIAGRMKEWTFWDHNIWYVPNALPQPNHYMERLLDNKFESLLIFIKGQPDKYEFHKPRVPQKYAVADPRPEKKNKNGRCLGNILRIPAYRPPNVRQGNYHVAAYPEELVAFFLQTYTSKGDTVVDPFLGSGTTLKVARVMERNGIGYEVHGEYEPLITARIEELWETPDWRSLDILHSSTLTPGTNGHQRKAQYRQRPPGQNNLFGVDN
jgi:modification methylase